MALPTGTTQSNTEFPLVRNSSNGKPSVNFVALRQALLDGQINDHERDLFRRIMGAERYDRFEQEVMA